MDKNFKTRLIVGFSMFAVALLGLYTFDGVPFKIIFGLFTLMSAIELISFFQKKHKYSDVMLAIIEAGFLLYGVIFISQIDVFHFWYIILGVPGYDIFAYLLGKAFGGKVFKESRPFPKISKNKTWEGTILGLLMSFLMVLILMLSLGSISSDWVYLLAGPFALMGDLFESYLKRRFDIKDSNEILIKNKFFSYIELCVGGSEGHGGFLDRIDSTAFASTMLLIIMFFL